jgi:hypothetical protein
MAAGPGYIGITETAEVALMQSVELELKLSDVVRKGYDGGFGVAHAFDPMAEGSYVALGTDDQAVASALALELASVSGGKTVVNSKERKVQFTHAPAATVPE